MIYLVSYDVRDPTRLRHVAKCLEGFGVRVQYSVFECELTPTMLEDMRRAVLDDMDTDEDSLRIYRICADCARYIERHGDVGCMEGHGEAVAAIIL